MPSRLNGWPRAFVNTASTGWPFRSRSQWRNAPTTCSGFCVLCRCSERERRCPGPHPGNGDQSTPRPASQSAMRPAARFGRGDLTTWFDPARIKPRHFRLGLRSPRGFSRSPSDHYVYHCFPGIEETGSISTNKDCTPSPRDIHVGMPPWQTHPVCICL